MVAFRVEKYSILSLKDLFKQVSKTPTQILEKKTHLTYFKEYFTELNAKTIVVEDQYVDHDYLEDFSAYYVKCFKEYKRFCTRLHFFNIDLNTKEFKKVLISESTSFNQNSLQEAYLGFIVVKPIPITFIGRTCLKIYPKTNGRNYHFLHTYNVNLFGLKLKVESLAYQEQDSIVSACASSAIWTAFQATAFLFQHSVPTPVEITKAALKFFPYANRHFPNTGLSPEQMAYAVRNVGLEPFLIDASDLDIIKATVYAYQKAEIPLIMGVELLKPTGIIGKHAITITGYRLEGAKSGFGKSKFYLKSSRIVKIYAHDDQVGPFARMEFQKGKLFLSTSWPDEKGVMGNVSADPIILLIPLYNKLRITFNTILNIIHNLDELIKVIDSNLGIGISDIEWEIFMLSSNGLKEEIADSNLDQDEKFNYLTKNLPKYVWRAIAHFNGEKLEFLFDTTDIDQGEIFLGVIKYSDNLFKMIKTIADNTDLKDVKSVQLQSIFSDIRN